MEKRDGIIEGLSKEKIWLEMSTTDDQEVRRLGELVKSKGAIPVSYTHLTLPTNREV